MDPIIAGTVGMPIRLTLLDAGSAHDPRGATVRRITLIAPGGVPTVHDADVGVDSCGRPCLEYVTQAGDLAQPGAYVVLGYLEDPPDVWPAAPVKFRVYPAG